MSALGFGTIGGVLGALATRSVTGAGVGLAVGTLAGALLTRTPSDPSKRRRVPGDPVVITVPAEDATTAIARAYNLAPMFAHRIVIAALRVGADPFDLANLIRFETGGTFHPAQQSGRKLGSPFDPTRATGLIQFTATTAKSLGTSTAALAKMSHLEQMDYVERYLTEVALGRRGGVPGPLDTAQALFMGVFYPAARYWPPAKAFPSWVQEGNPGIYTPLDYMEKALRYAELPSSFTPAQAAGLVDCAGWVVTGGMEALPEWLIDGVSSGWHPSGEHAGVAVGFVPSQSWAELASGPGPYSLERIFLISNYSPDQYGWAAIPSTMSAYGSALKNTPAAVYLPNNQLQFGTGYGPAYLSLPHDAVPVQPPSYAWQQNVSSRTADLARRYAQALMGNRVYLEVPFRSWPGGIAHGVTYRTDGGGQNRLARRLATTLARSENLRAVWFESTLPGAQTVYFTAAPQILLRQVNPPRPPRTNILAGLDELAERSATQEDPPLGLVSLV